MASDLSMPAYPSELRNLEDNKRGEKWARGALDAEAAIVAGAMNGTRNTMLNNAALKLGHKVAAGYLQATEVEAALMEAAQRSGLAQEDGAEAVRATIRSGLTAGMRTPEHPQDRPDHAPRQGPQRAPVQRAPRLNTFTAADLQGMRFEDIRWVVPDLIPEGLTILAGAPKLGKSWMTLDMAIAVASGGETLGEYCDQGDVLLLALEDNQRRLQRRMNLLMKGAPWPAALQFSTECPRLDSGGEAAIKAWIEASDNPRLVVIDTLAMVKPPAKAKGSAYDSDVAALKGLHRLAADYRVSIIVVTHLRKAEADDPVERINSTMGQSGVADTLVVLMRGAGGADAEIHARGRDLEEKNHTVRMENCRWQILDNSLDAGTSENRKLIWEAVRDGAETPKAVTDVTGLSDSNVRQLLRRLVRDGHLMQPKRGHYAVPTDPLSQPSQCHNGRMRDERL